MSDREIDDIHKDHSGRARTELSVNLQKNPQNYVPLPEQPWLDGYVVEKGIIR